MIVIIDSLAFGGEAVGRADGLVLFVAGGVPGDELEVRVVERKPRFARAEIVRVVRPSPDRIEPPCPIAHECGGCPWQMVAVSAQLREKETIVRRALGRVSDKIDPILEAPASLGYRTRVKMTKREGVLGFQARKSHRLVAIDHCVALDPRLDAALNQSRAKILAKLAEGDSVSAVISPKGEVGLSTDGEQLIDVGEERSHVTSPSGFQQASEVQNRVLRALVRDALDVGGYDLLELYAGDGNFTRDLTDARKIVAVESDRAAAARLSKNVSSARVLALPSEIALAQLSADKFDRVLLDPPRAGAKEAIAGIARLEPERIVYVSCDPMTLARDLADFKSRGYEIARVQPIDMMPHTSHVETVVTLVRAARA